MTDPARSPKPLTAEQEAAHAEWDKEVAALTAHAEAALQGEAVNVPDVIYSGLQEAGIFSADPEIDADPAIAAKAQSLLQLVKEFSVSPSGNWEMALTPREIVAIGDDRRWCTNCYADQHAISEEDWEVRMARLEERVGPRPEGSTPKTRCPICGAGLGFAGIIEAEKLTGPESFTPEQRGLIEEFFQGKYTLEPVNPEEQADADSSGTD